MYIIENKNVRVGINSFGAELKSLVRKDTGKEYMWCADEKYWKRTAPVLFPFVGSVNNGEYRTKGAAYKMGQHGFARDMEFSVISQTEDELWFELKSDETTYSKYPYDFTLRIGYKLIDEGVKVIWQVSTSEDCLPFSIGGHPAFNCGNKDMCSLQFDTSKAIVSHRLDGGLVTDIEDVFSLKDRVLDITEEMFDNDALIVEDGQANIVSLCDETGKAYVTVEMNGAPVFGIWSPVGKRAPFICIEPWYGRADEVGYSDVLANRKWSNVVKRDQVWEKSYNIIVK